MAKFTWHKMADEVPPFGKGNYVIMGKRGAMFYADEYGTKPRSTLRTWFHVPNNRCVHKDADEVYAWAEIPPMEAKPSWCDHAEYRNYHKPTIEDVLVDYYKECQLHASKLNLLGLAASEDDERVWRGIATTFVEKLREVMTDDDAR